jgi:transmembrane sensor
MDAFQDRLNEAAARWYARLHAHDCSPEDRAAFEAWCRGDPANAAAYAAAEHFGEALARLSMDEPRLKAMVDEAAGAGATLPSDSDEEPAAACGSAAGERSAARAPGGAPVSGASAVRRSRTRRWALVAAVAATGVAAVIGLGLQRATRNDVETYAALRYAAGAERRAVQLEDGTKVHLDVRSVAEVRFMPGEREVTLLRGRALFDVAHDAARPFTVAAGGSRVTALGTVFQVDRTGEQLVVTLADGAIEVTPAAAGFAGERVRLAPGDEIRVQERDFGWVKRTVDARSATSWSFGRHMFRETPLADALKEINRYASVKVRLADPVLAELAVSGNFAAGDSESIVSALAAVLPLRVAPTGAELWLYRSGAAERR